MKFNLISCFNKKYAIGKDGDLLYHLPHDLRNFKNITTYGGVVIMGRKTFESLPNKQPLKNRINIVITTQENLNVDGEYDNLFIVDSVEMAINFCEAYYSDKECYVIGGSTIYQQFLDLDAIDTMYLTVVNREDEGDVYFPKVLEDDKWKLFYESYTQRHRTEDITYKFVILKQ